MEQKRDLPMPVFIGNLIVLCLILLVLCSFLMYLYRWDNLLFRIMAALIFVVIIFWKVFSIIVISIPVVGLLYIIFGKNISKVKSEVIFTSFGLAVSMCVGFIFSAGVKSGKPDIDPLIFFSYFKLIFIWYLVTRIAIVIIGIFREKVRG